MASSAHRAPTQSAATDSPETDTVDNKQFRVFQFGLADPTDWDGDCDQEIFRMNRLWNSLVEIEHKYQREYNELLSLSENAKQPFHDLESLHTKNKQNRIRLSTLVRKSAAELDIYEARTAINEMNKRIAEKSKEIKAIRKLYHQENSDLFRKLEISRRNAVKQARQSSDLWWGNYNAIVRQYEQGRKAAISDGSHLRFKRYDKSGRITNQIQGGMTTTSLFNGKSTQVQVAPISDEAWITTVGSRKKDLQRTILTATIFVRDGQRRTASWPMLMHRPIPIDFIVKEVVITRRRVGLTWRWGANFVCVQALSIPFTSRSKGVAAVDLGWRRSSEGLRVATVMRSDSETARYLFLDSTLLSKIEYSERLRAERDLMRFELVRAISEARWEHAPAGLKCLIPASGLTGMTDISLHELAARWALHSDWEKNYVPVVERWRVRNKRVYLEETNVREKLANRRKDLYRKFAKEIVDNSGLVLVNRLTLRGRVGADRLKAIPEAVHRYRSLAAPGLFREWIQIQARKQSVRVMIVDDPVTWRCHVCGAMVQPAHPELQYQICHECNASWDQDVNACQNMLLRGNINGPHK